MIGLIFASIVFIEGHQRVGRQPFLDEVAEDAQASLGLKVEVCLLGVAIEVVVLGPYRCDLGRLLHSVLGLVVDADAVVHIGIIQKVRSIRCPLIIQVSCAIFLS